MTAIAIFVKTPGLSPIKTRLASSIGQSQATELYRRCAAAVAEAAVDADVGPVYWAAAEPSRRIGEHWSDLPRLAQGEGGLGERMYRVLERLVDRHGSGLLLGADAPQIDPAHLQRAAAWLGRGVDSRVVGPARDGGFWTFGANHCPPLNRWTRVEYSRADTLSHFRDSIGDDAEWLDLPGLTDLDTADDLPMIGAELARLRRPLLRQRQLAELIAVEAEQTVRGIPVRRP